MTFLRLAGLASFFLLGCGGESHPVCPSEKHLANPDGHGERCISDESSCGAASDCAQDSECCTASCVDDDGSGVYDCAQSCRSPECTEGSCAAGWRCQAGVDSCTAYCVPDDLPCEDGWILGDPSGTGTWQCIRDDSTCSRRSDCPDSADGCCLGACADQGDSQFACTQDCAGFDTGRPAGGGDDGAAMWECTTNQDCESMMGQPGWTCAQTACWGNECQPPVAECVVDGDCVLAIDITQCCADCALAYSRTELANNECLVEQPGGSSDAEAPPEDPPVCGPVDCSGIACPAVECMPPLRAGCSEGQCIPVY